MPRKQAGFTLVEIAIVLVIIGLLLGGVLKGQELINSAKIKNVINDFTSTTTAIYGYQDRYKRLPGDDEGTTRWTTSNAAFGTGKIIGDHDGVINTAGADCVFTSNSGDTNECYTFWVDLRQAGFITGNLLDGPPQNAYSGVLGIMNGQDAFQSAAGAGTGFKGPIICESNIPDKAAIAIDNQLDDGNPSTGSIRAVLQTGATTPATLAQINGVAAPAAYDEKGTNYYTICKSL
ncbi:Prepilin-type cleavage/methylation domain-containing protein [Georgfuchsia toluolica]|uniref:Prepilin-type cleavage/methylation domain-containing protein n=1 Tax=Georgfuchsia toluolica TaxID=424218 RepID=A0A916N987_9PROT|nr:prepilin-type N-terminal cleavage/methylation domain-containing protein [Georgfuchsia toluolica]CAG4884232.1 Prepilin-type cleavage/methylation domain-containing protein [Georgfuchsia toluolica]